MPIAQGIAASVIATLMLGAWIAIGSIFLSRFRSDDAVTAPIAILIGSGITCWLLAIFCAAGMVWPGTAVVSAISVIAVVLRWRRMWNIATAMLDPLVMLTHRAGILVLAVILWVIMWAAAISPPRSADAMRYHLAHIRQIIADGRWERIVDYHYALPFGWSLSYLPFEYLGLPQGSQLLGLALFVVVISTMVRVFKWGGAAPGGVLAGLLLMLHPASLRVFIEANADAYALLVVVTVSALILRMQSLSSRETAMLAFASFIGLQSRYQLVAVAGAATVLFLITLRRHLVPIGAFIASLVGVSGALILASPFYWANWKWFGNPVWPLMADPGRANATYADVFAYTYSKSISGSHTLRDYVTGIERLLTVPYQVPLSIAIVAIIVISFRHRQLEIRALGIFGALFLLEWAVMQPSLYPRFILLMLPVAVFGLGFLLSSVVESRPRFDRAFLALGAAATVALIVLAAAVNRHSLKYMIDGNADEYHRYTWFYPVYRWINQTVPADARMLVIVSSGTTYYLERPYRRADPWISGEIDWRNVRNGAGLDSLLARKKFDYMIYENRDWSEFPGGTEMAAAVGDAYKRGLLARIQSFTDTLYSSRREGTFHETRVHVLKRGSR